MATMQARPDERVKQLSLWRKLLSRPELGAVAGALLMFIFFALAAGGKGFLRAQGVMSWLEVSAQFGILAIGAALLMIGGQFDLSVGSMIGAAGVLITIPVTMFGWMPWQAILLAFVAAIIVGLINGFLVNRTGLPSFIVTLAFLYALRGLTIGFTRLLTGRTQVDTNPLIGKYDFIKTPDDAKAFLQNDIFGRLFTGDVGQPLFRWLADNGIWLKKLPNGAPEVAGIPVSVVWWLGLLVIAAWILAKTPFGNWIFAVGGNAESARNTGVPVELVRLLLFIGTAVCATIFACLQVFDFASADVLRGNLKEFEAIIAAVVGGCLLTGGYGSVVGSAFGALTFGMLSQGLFMTGWNTDWFKVCLGTFLLAAVLINNYIRKRSTEAK